MAAKGNVPHDDFKSGFQVGYQAVMGIRRIVPVPPIKPITKIGMTPFLMGPTESVANKMGTCFLETSSRSRFARAGRRFLPN